jgi:hypothetical protein
MRPLCCKRKKTEKKEKKEKERVHQSIPPAREGD